MPALGVVKLDTPADATSVVPALEFAREDKTAENRKEPGEPSEDHYAGSEQSGAMRSTWRQGPRRCCGRVNTRHNVTSRCDVKTPVPMHVSRRRELEVRPAAEHRASQDTASDARQRGLLQKHT